MGNFSYFKVILTNLRVILGDFYIFVAEIYNFIYFDI